VLSHLPAPLLGAITALLMLGNLLFWAMPLYCVTLARLVLPLPGWRERCAATLVRIAENWIDGNSTILGWTQRITWDVRGLESLCRNRWYMVASNHCSSVDIVVLQRVLNRRIPFIKFFIKQELLYVPVLGLAWWALDFPFMRRYSQAQLDRRPELRGKDLETTRQTCRRFLHKPSTILNFLEGTRATPQKQAEQGWPYRHLLRPKAGGIALVIAAMGNQLHSLLDVTLVYPQQRNGFWDLISGGIRHVIVQINEIAIPSEFAQGDYASDPQFRERFQAWVCELWQAKDALIEQLTLEARLSPAR
jgi:1-acyl-sn-glycerol-3-phosphate acyltransferase